MPELNSLLIEARTQRSEDRKFFAALKGIDLEKEATEDAVGKVFDNARKKVEELTGVEEVDPNIKEFIDNGIEYEVYDG